MGEEEIRKWEVRMRHHHVIFNSHAVASCGILHTCELEHPNPYSTSLMGVQKFPEGTVVKLQETLLKFGFRYIIDVICEYVPISYACWNYPLSRSRLLEDATFGEGFRQCYEVAFTKVFASQFQKLNSTDESALTQAISRIQGLIDDLIRCANTSDRLVAGMLTPCREQKERLASGEKREGAVPDYVGKLLASDDPFTGNPMEYDQVRTVYCFLCFGIDRAQLRRHVSLAVVAGYHSSTVAVSWTLFLLSQHPECQTRLQTEIGMRRYVTRFSRYSTEVQTNI